MFALIASYFFSYNNDYKNIISKYYAITKADNVLQKKRKCYVLIYQVEQRMQELSTCILLYFILYYLSIFMYHEITTKPFTFLTIIILRSCNND